MILDIKDAESVEEWIQTEWFRNGIPTIVYYDDSWYCKKGGIWEERREYSVEIFLTEKLRGYTDRRGIPLKLPPARKSELMSDLRTHLSIGIADDRIIPAIFNEETQKWESYKGEIIMGRNSIISLSDFSTKPNYNIFATGYVNWAPTENDKCPTWFAFLDSLEFSDEKRELLQEMMGYILTGETKLQKAFLLIGPKRAGKGTIGHVLTELVGESNTTAASLSDLGSSFGLQGFVGKKLALFSDGHTSSRSESVKAVEDILKISSGDSISVNRKFKSVMSTVLRARIVMMGNELPTLSDTSDAVYSRFCILQFTKEFIGKEDTFLIDKLRAEMSAIAKWSMIGYKRLMKRGQFKEVAIDRKTAWHESNDQFRAFTNECLDFSDPDIETTTQAIFSTYTMWAENNGQRPTSKQYLFKKLDVIFMQHKTVSVVFKKIKGVRVNVPKF